MLDNIKQKAKIQVYAIEVLISSKMSGINTWTPDSVSCQHL